ncbi:MAG: hypothetical protein ACYCQJ_04025 [Nitrososphaerales archaeon]
MKLNLDNWTYGHYARDNEEFGLWIEKVERGAVTTVANIFFVGLRIVVESIFF